MHCAQATAKPEKFARWRAVELKHGRIAMAATTGDPPPLSPALRPRHVGPSPPPPAQRERSVPAGYIVQTGLRFPGYLSTSENVKFADLPNGILALKGVPALGLAQILLFIGAMEVVTWRYYEGPWPGTPPAGKLPGDVAGEFWVRYDDPEVKATKLNIEINNGRAAMMGITGMLMHDHLTGNWIPPGF